MKLYRLLGYVVRPGMVVGFYVYNKIFTTPRPRVVIVDDEGRVFLVRHWGSRRTWSLPGGGAKIGESAELAAQRELREEVGVEAPIESLRYVTTVITEYTAPIFLLRTDAEVLPPQPYNRRELVAAGWFTLDALPSRLTVVTQKALAALAKQG